ncbi:MAG: PhnD/SsuA/transferrin family substrate-binding protein [Candidatus Dormibacteraeota bacterium]|nr:PhnD/SsuA/transferrin family substrate-binding protein [Candidatus Dormibacteraeota bacterium]
MGTEPLVVGAVAYASRAVPIWEGIRDYFNGSAQPMDYVLFSNYGRQVDSLLAGQIDIAWNTNLAWVRTVRETGGRCVALAMRDTDVGYQSLLVSTPDSGLSTAADVQGRRLALGSRDSAQAAILPLHFLRRQGVELAALELVRFDSDVGKHGDTGASELEAMKSVMAGTADAAAIGISTWTAPSLPSEFRAGLKPFWTSPAYCHCNFSARDMLDPERREAWTTHLLAMDWDHPDHRPILEMEGLRRWVRPQLEGYEVLFEATRDIAGVER